MSLTERMYICLVTVFLGSVVNCPNWQPNDVAAWPLNDAIDEIVPHATGTNFSSLETNLLGRPPADHF